MEFVIISFQRDAMPVKYSGLAAMALTHERRLEGRILLSCDFQQEPYVSIQLFQGGGFS
jgi:hypothetical protein